MTLGRRPYGQGWSASISRIVLLRGRLAHPSDSEYHARHAEANLFLHLASHAGLGDREAYRGRLLFLMDHEVMSPTGNRLALNDGRYRTKMVHYLVDLLCNM